MEEDFEKVGDLIHETLVVTKFILSGLDGGSKAPLKVTRSSTIFIKKTIFVGLQRSTSYGPQCVTTCKRSR